ncbi:MAG: hypothetical protein WCE75_07425 [Terracidiphilus sp.]
MPERKIEDRLREEYFDLLPEIRRVLWQLETEIRFRTLPILHSLRPHEQLVIRSRIKDCESALRRIVRQPVGTTPGQRTEGGEFVSDRPEEYSIRNLPDLAGVRVLVFPNERLIEVDRVLRPHFQNWTCKPVKDESGAILAPKYFGHCDGASEKILGEYQIAPMLLGLFWEVEHPAMYKFRAVARFKMMRERRANVERALSEFETGLEGFLRNRPQQISSFK